MSKTVHFKIFHIDHESHHYAKNVETIRYIMVLILYGKSGHVARAIPFVTALSLFKLIDELNRSNTRDCFLREHLVLSYHLI